MHRARRAARAAAPSLRRPAVLLLAIALAVLPGCQMNERMSGTIFGATGGAVIGGVAGGGVGGVLLGGLSGAVAGYLVGDYLADRRERACCPPATSAPAAWAPQVGGVKARDAGARRAAEAALARGRAAPDTEAARRAYAEAVALDPGLADAWNALGLEHLFAGDETTARRAFERALAADPRHVGARKNLRRLAGS